jgi:hypothetical protein
MEMRRILPDFYFAGVYSAKCSIFGPPPRSPPQLAAKARP